MAGNGKQAISSAELSSFCSQVALILSAGLPLYDGMETLSETTKGSEFAELYGTPQGVGFAEVAEGSPAEEAGAQKGDILTELNGRTMTSVDEVLNEMQYYQTGEEVELTILRADNGEYKEMTLTVTLGTKDAISSLQAPHGAPFPSFGGIQRTLSISYSPFVIILNIAFLSAHIPSVEQVSMHTPTYIFPDFDLTAADTSPAVT